MIPALAGLAALAALTAVDPAPAPGPTAATAPPAPAVAIQRAEDADPVVREASLRLGSELRVAGFAGRVVACKVDPVTGPSDCPDSPDSISLARDPGATAIFAASGLPGGRHWQRRLWVADRDGGNDATLIAVRAVELLRDVQIHLTAAANDDEDPEPVELFTQPPGSRGTSPWALLIGVNALTVPWTTQVAFFPVFGAALGVGRQLGQRAYVLAEASGPYWTYLPIAIDPTQREVDIFDRPLYQVFGMASARAAWSSPWSGPFAAVRAGVRVMHLRLDASNLDGDSVTRVMGVGGVGLGWAVPLGNRLFATLEAHVDLSNPVVIVDNRGVGPLDATGRWFGGLDLTAAIAGP